MISQIHGGAYTESRLLAEYASIDMRERPSM